MKKVLISAVIVLLVILSTNVVLATVETNKNNIIQSNTASEILEIKEETQSEIDKYVKKYGSDSYGMVAYVLNKVRLYSIPFCFIGIAIGGIYQYAIGTRRLDMKQKGFALILSFVTILVICQILPLIFAIVVKGWRG